MTKSFAARAERAVTTLTQLGALGDLGLRFSVIAPRANGRLRAHRLTLSDDAGADIALIAERTRERLRTATQLDYGPAVLIPSGHCMRLPQRSAATLTEVQAEVDNSDTEVFDATAAYAADATMAAARFSTQSGTSVTFYRVNETLLQFHKRKVLGLVFRDGRYDRLEPADVLLMRSEFDVVVVDGIAFFFSKPKFEKAFGFLDELRRTSGQTFDAVTANLRIKGVTELREACTNNTQMMAKMASIRRSMDEDPGYAEAMSMPRLTKFVRDHPQLGIEVEGRGQEQQLVFNPSLATRFKILNLLDDDYLRSVLTDRDYEAGSKIRT